MKSNSESNTLYITVILSLAVGFLGGYLGSEFNSNSVDVTQSTQRQIVSSEQDLITDIISEVSDSVVSINVTGRTISLFGDVESAGAGTGIIISSDGYILTNRHVIPENSESIEIITSDGTVYSDVEVVGRDPRSSVDIAYLKINNVNDLKPAKIGDSDQLKIGTKVIAIGNALGEFQNSVTTGIISGRSRPIVAGSRDNAESLTNLLQTDAAINPGNSGGPLLNLNGEVIGVNTAVARAENIGFAIPIADVAGSINSVLTTGELVVPYIGVRYIAIDEDVAEELDLDVTEGVILSSRGGVDPILADSPASKAGLEAEDIITEVDGVTINANNGLGTLIGRRSVGDTVRLTVIRSGETIEVELTLEAAPETFN